MKILSVIIDVLFPKICLGCETKLLPEQEVLCLTCASDMPVTNFQRHKENQVYKLIRPLCVVEDASAFLYFHKKGIVQNLIHQLKYKGNEAIGEYLANWYTSILDTEKYYTTIDAVVVVPLHSSRLRTRGYNQVSKFGKVVAQHLGVPLYENYLIKTKNRSTQAFKDRILRQQDNEVFAIGNLAHVDSVQHVLLIDDVITTGSTIAECVKVLKNQNLKVSVMAMALTE